MYEREREREDVCVRKCEDVCEEVYVRKCVCEEVYVRKCVCEDVCVCVCVCVCEEELRLAGQ